MATKPEWYEESNEDNINRCEYFISRKTACNKDDSSWCRCHNEGWIRETVREQYGYK